MAPIWCSSIEALWAGLSRTDSSPPCTLGCSVFTRPSIISGKPVRSEMSRTATPVSAISLCVPPVDTSSTPSRASSLAKSAMPDLSNTDSKARLMGMVLPSDIGNLALVPMRGLLARMRGLANGPFAVILNYMVQFQHYDSTFAALSDATRRGVLEQLVRSDASITQLADRFGMTLTGMKKHVSVLEEAGLVATRKQGRGRNWRVG